MNLDNIHSSEDSHFQLTFAHQQDTFVSKNDHLVIPPTESSFMEK